MLKHALRQDELRLQPHQLEIIASHIGCQQTSGGLHIRLGGLGLAQGCVQRRLVFAKEVQFPARSGL